MPFESATATVQMLIAASGSEAVQGGLVPLNFGKVGFYLALLVGCALFAAIAGLASSWIDRKVTALVQARVGPPMLQPLWDLLKLMGKETVIPEGANRLTFVLMPLVALAAAALAATILLANVLWQNGLLPSYGGLSQYGTVGDLIMVLYLLAVPSLALVIGASSSNNPFASVGASREMKLMSYELPLLLAVVTALVLASTTERRFTTELQKQVDARTAAASPLHSQPDVPGPVNSVLALRFDQLLALRGAGPDADGRLRLRLAEGRLRAQLDAWQEEAGVDLRETGRKQEALKGELARLLKSLEAAPPAGQEANLRNELRQIEAEIGLAGDRQSRLADRRKSLSVEQSRLDLAKLERGEKELRARSDAGPGPGARAAMQRYTQRVADKRGEIEAAGSALAPASQGALVLDAPVLSKAVASDGLARLLEIFALALCVAVALFCAQAKLGLVPFDCAEAETEIAGGVLIEYGGPLLGAWKLARQMLLFVMPVFIGMVFLGGFRLFVPEGSAGASAWQAVVSVLKFVAVLVVFVLVRNTNPRVRIDQAMRFFLGPMTALAVLALIVAMAARFLLLGGVV